MRYHTRASRPDYAQPFALFGNKLRHERRRPHSMGTLYVRAILTIYPHLLQIFATQYLVGLVVVLSRWHSSTFDAYL